MCFLHHGMKAFILVLSIRVRKCHSLKYAAKDAAEACIAAYARRKSCTAAYVYRKHVEPSL